MIDSYADNLFNNVKFGFFLGVCYLRLDFENFDVNGLTSTNEFEPAGATGSAVACTDKFTITV